MTDNEKIILLQKYIFEIEFALKNDYISQLNNFIIHRSSNPDDMLKLYRAQVRYDAYKEMCSNIDKILYGR